MQLEAGELPNNTSGQEELGRLARVRYLVLGSIFPLNGVTINARLVEVKSGLVVQTAKLNGPSFEALVPRLAQLGQMLLMTDEQKLAFEQALAQRAPEVPPAPLDAPLPPPPALNDPPPPPVFAYSARPPALGGLLVEDFRTFPAVAVVPAPPPVVVTIDPFRRRLLAVSLELGDNLFRRGRQREAFRHFELALSLSDGHPDVALRVERCRPFVPPPVVVVPPPVVVVQPQPVFAPPVVVVTRPRLVVFNFLVNAQPGLVPPAVGDWAADHFVSYCGSTYEVIERGEVCWYMGRLNITMRDVLYNPAARRALSQALGVRFFMFGAIEQTASFNVSANMIDAETGARTGSGMIHVQDHNEIKLRMAELVRQTGAGAKEQAQLAQAGAATEKALTEARKQLSGGDATRAAATARAALQAAPGNVALAAVLAQAEQQKKQTELEAARRVAAERARVDAEAARKKQQELAKQAETLRLKAAAEAKAQDAATRRALEEQKQRVAAKLRAEALAAAQKGDYRQAAVTFQSVAALKPDDTTARELTAAKAKAEEANRLRLAAEAAQRAAETKRLAEAAAAKVAQERRLKEAEDAQRRKAQEARDQAQYAQLITQAKGAFAKKELDAARSALDAARLLKATDEVAKLSKEVQDARTLEEAKAKGDAARLAAEKRLAEDKARTDKAAAEAKLKQDTFARRVKDAQEALAAKKYDQAIAAYQEAGKLFRTDAVLSGLKQAEQLRDADRQALLQPMPQPKVEPTIDPKKVEAKKVEPKKIDPKQADYELAMSAGQAALKKNDFQGAVNSFKEALRLNPTSREASTYLQDANTRLTAATRAAEDAKRREEYNRLMTGGKQAVALKKYDDAVQLFTAALKLQPGDTAATDALRQATQARLQPMPQPKVEPKKVEPKKAEPKSDPKAEYNRLMQSGAALEKSEKMNDAIQSYRKALQLAPSDAAALTALRRTELPLLLTAGKQALAARRFPDAAKSFEAALQLAPDNAEAKTGLKKARNKEP
jgi:tetratricopeptide (TPR) repeat protein